MLRSLAVAARRGGAVALRQQQRSFAEAAVATPTTIWDELGELVTSDEGKRELATLRSTYVDIASKLAERAKEPEPIKWDEWKNEIDPKLVNEFKATYENMKLPKYETNDIQEASAQFSVLMKEAEGLVAASQSRIAEIQAELANIQKEKERLDTTTVDEELARNPEMAKEIDEELQQNYFMVV